MSKRERENERARERESKNDRKHAVLSHSSLGERRGNYNSVRKETFFEGKRQIFFESPAFSL